MSCYPIDTLKGILKGKLFMHKKRRSRKAGFWRL